MVQLHIYFCVNIYKKLTVSICCLLFNRMKIIFHSNWSDDGSLCSIFQCTKIALIHIELSFIVFHRTKRKTSPFTKRGRVGLTSHYNMPPTPFKYSREGLQQPLTNGKVQLKSGQRDDIKWPSRDLQQCVTAGLNIRPYTESSFLE